MLNVLLSKQRHALSAKQNQRQRQEMLTVHPKAAIAGGGDRDNRCCCCTELSTQRKSDKNDQDFQEVMVGMPPAARKDNQNRVVNPSLYFMFAFSPSRRAEDCVNVTVMMLQL